MSTQIYVTIAVYKGDPVDYQKYRHTALYFQFQDGSKPLLIHAVGPPGMLSVQMRENYVPSQSATFAKEVAIGWLQVTLTRPQLISFVLDSEPDNGDREYNCHSWIEVIIRRMRDAGYILPNTYSASLDGMMAATLEATDE